MVTEPIIFISLPETSSSVLDVFTIWKEPISRKLLSSIIEQLAPESINVLHTVPLISHRNVTVLLVVALPDIHFSSSVEKMPRSWGLPSHKYLGHCLLQKSYPLSPHEAQNLDGQLRTKLDVFPQLRHFSGFFDDGRYFCCL